MASTTTPSTRSTGTAGTAHRSQAPGRLRQSSISGRRSRRLLLDWLVSRFGPRTKPFPRTYVAQEITTFLSDGEARSADGPRVRARAIRSTGSTPRGTARTAGACSTHRHARARREAQRRGSRKARRMARTNQGNERKPMKTADSLLAPSSSAASSWPGGQAGSAGCAGRERKSILTRDLGEREGPGTPVKIRIFRWSSDEERTPLVTALTAPPPAPVGGRRTSAGRGRTRCVHGAAAAAAPGSRGSAAAAPACARSAAGRLPPAVPRGRPRRRAGGAAAAVAGRPRRRRGAADADPGVHGGAAEGADHRLHLDERRHRLLDQVRVAHHAAGRRPNASSSPPIAGSARTRRHGRSTRRATPTDYEFTVLELHLDPKGGEGQDVTDDEVVADNDDEAARRSRTTPPRRRFCRTSSDRELTD